MEKTGCSILNKNDNLEIQNRVKSISENSNRSWGKMNVNEMICHVTDQIRMALGQFDIQDKGNFLQKNVLKSLVLIGMPAPKGKVKTFNQLDQNKE